MNRGNHDVSYLWETMKSGYSYYARETVVNRIQDLKNSIPPENAGFIRKIDNVVFSHAGLTESFVIRHFGRVKTDLDSIICRNKGLLDALEKKKYG